MSNITLSVDDEIIRKVRKLAIDKHTTMTEMIRNYLQSVAERECLEKKRVVNRLKKTFKTYSRDMGKRTWTREGLHER